jgi:hypothetical protein
MTLSFGENYCTQRSPGLAGRAFFLATSCIDLSVRRGVTSEAPIKLIAVRLASLNKDESQSPCLERDQRPEFLNNDG